MQAKSLSLVCNAAFGYQLHNLISIRTDEVILFWQQPDVVYRNCRLNDREYTAYDTFVSPRSRTTETRGMCQLFETDGTIQNKPTQRKQANSLLPPFYPWLRFLPAVLVTGLSAGKGPQQLEPVKPEIDVRLQWEVHHAVQIARFEH